MHPTARAGTIHRAIIAAREIRWCRSMPIHAAYRLLDDDHSTLDAVDGAAEWSRRSFRLPPAHYLRRHGCGIRRISALQPGSGLPISAVGMIAKPAFIGIDDRPSRLQAVAQDRSAFLVARSSGRPRFLCGCGAHLSRLLSRRLHARAQASTCRVAGWMTEPISSSPAPAVRPVR